MTMKTLLTTLCLLTLTVVNAQNWIDLANVFWRVSPYNGIEGSTEKRHLNTYVADAKLPVVINDKNVFILGLEHQHNTITSTASSALYPNYTFSSSMMQLGWEHKWNDRSKMLFMAIPRFNSDYKDVSLRHFQLGGLALGTTKRNENFDWKYGLYYNGELFGPMFVPLFGFNWKMNDHWRFKLIVPLNFELSYKPGDRFRAGIRFDGVNASYAYQAIEGVPLSNGYIDKADNNAWLFSEFHFGKNIWFHLKAGHSVLRKYRYFTEGDKMSMKLGPVNIGDDRNFNDPKTVPVLFKNGFSFEARFIYRLPL